MNVVGKVFEKYGMVVGSGIGDITNRNIEAFSSWPWIGIALGTGYILVVSLVIIRLFILQPNRSSLTQIMRSNMNPRLVSLYTLLTALTFTCGGLHVASNAVTFDPLARNAQHYFVMTVVSICALIMWQQRQLLSKFCEWSGFFEIMRYATIILASFVLHVVSSAQLPAGQVADSTVAGSQWHGAVLKALLSAIFAFAGFESAAQSVGSTREVILILIATIALASGTYMLTAQAAVPMVMSSPAGVPGPQIVPRLAATASSAILGNSASEGIVYTAALVVQVVAILNGTAGCVCYSTELLEDTAVAGHLGPLSNWCRRTKQRSPAALLVLATAILFWLTGQYAGLLETFATMNSVTHGFCAVVLLSFALSRRSVWDVVLASACLALVIAVLVAVLIIEESPGMFAATVVCACGMVTLL